MNLSFLFLFLIVPSLAVAATFKASIHHVDHGAGFGEPDLLMFSDGRIGVLGKTKFKYTVNEEYEITLDKKNQVVRLTPLPKEEPMEEGELSAKASYQPSKVSPVLVEEIFGRMRRDYQKESQCYNRAHVWAFEEWKRSGLNAMKIYVFYTRRYIRDYNFYWWFHVVPAVYVGDELIALDRRYASTPLSLKPWTDIFVRSRRNCPFIAKYTDYENNQQTEHCFLHLSTMHFWQPRDLAVLERTGFTKTNFNRSEIDRAYQEAF